MRYKEEGDAGLIHSRRGQVALNAYNTSYREQVLEAYRNRYAGYGPTLAAEKLQTEGFSLSAETLRKWLKEAGLWEVKRKRSQYRKRRLRRERFGELLQMDGSFHRWFGQDQGQSCLMNVVDDATGTTCTPSHRAPKYYFWMQCIRNTMQWQPMVGLSEARSVSLKLIAAGND